MLYVCTHRAQRLVDVMTYLWNGRMGGMGKREGGQALLFEPSTNERVQKGPVLGRRFVKRCNSSSLLRQRGAWAVL